MKLPLLCLKEWVDEMNSREEAIVRGVGESLRVFREPGAVEGEGTEEGHAWLLAEMIKVLDGEGKKALRAETEEEVEERRHMHKYWELVIGRKVWMLC